MRQSGNWEDQRPLDHETLKKLLKEKVAGLDLAALKADIKPFIVDTGRLEAWTQTLFNAAIEHLKVV